MANALIANNVNRPVQRVLRPMAMNGKGDVQIIQYPTLDAEVRGVLNTISLLIARGVPPGDILVLAQRGVIGTPIYEGLVARGVPVHSYYAEAELDAEDAQRRFALLKLFVDREDRVALRWLLGFGSNNWLSGGYQRLRNYCEACGVTPWQVLEQLETGSIRLPHMAGLVARFVEVKHEIGILEGLNDLIDLRSAIDRLFPEGDPRLRDIRALALETLAATGGEDRAAFLRELTTAIAKPEIPSEIEDVRVMSLHKSKGLSASVTIIAGCIEGLLPKQPAASLPQVEQIAQLEEQRRLFYVGISRVKACPADGRPGTLILTYSQQMPLATAMGAGISPAAMNYGNARLIASRFIREMGRAAPAPTAG
jgi:superfamily I DNA/RNA helicase